MNNENEKKKKKLLLPIIIAAAVLLLGGTAGILAMTGVFKGPETDPTGEEEEVSDTLFWNVDRDQYAGKSAIGTSSRQPDKDDGYYHVLFASEGRQVTRRVAEKRVVDMIDSNDLMGLVFDEKGIVIAAKTVESITGGYEIEGLYVKELLENGNVLFCSSSDLKGREFEIAIDSSVRIFDVCGMDSNRFIGEEIRKDNLTPGDRIFSVKNKEGVQTRAFITQRTVEPQIYWNVTRMYDSTIKATTRTPNENGEYEILMAVNGEQVVVKTKNRDTASKIDAVSAKCMSMTFDKDGYVMKLNTNAGSVVGGGTFGSWAHITKLEGNHIIAEKIVNASDKGKIHDGTMAENVRVFDVSGTGGFVGQEIFDLRESDQIHALKNGNNEVQIIFVVGRLHGDMYWNIDRKYSSTAKETTRTPEADGYYHFKMAVNGKQVDLKTADKKVASNVDSYAAKAMGLNLDGDIILGTYNANNTLGTGGGTAASWAEITKIYSATSFHTLKDPNSTAAKAGEELDLTMAPDCKIYNVSTNYDKYQGEPTTIKMDDTVHCFLNLKGEVSYVYVVTRPVKLPIYWNINRKYSSTTKASTRTPEADGYYHLKMAVDGKQVELRTKDKTLVDKIDASTNSCISLAVSGDIITKVYSASTTFDGKGGVTASWADVTKWNSATSFHTLKDPNSSSAKAGEELDLVLPANCKVYNVSSLVEDHVGEVTTVRLGDTIHCFMNQKKQITYVFVVGRKAPVVTKYCPVCDKDVQWTAYSGGFTYDETAPTHSYFYSSRTPNGNMGTTKAGEIHLDLNGKNINSADNFRAFNVTNKSYVYIMDLSDAKTSKVIANGGQQGVVNGTMFAQPYTASTLYLMNLTIDGTNAKNEEGTGLIFSATNAKLVLDNCTVIAGSAKNGAAIYSKGDVTLKNTKIIGGTSVEGGSVYLEPAGTLTVEGNTTISGGKRKDGTASNIYLLEGKVMNIADGFTGEVSVRAEASGVITANNTKNFISNVKSDIADATISATTGDALRIDYVISGVKFESETLDINRGTPTALKVEMVPAKVPGTVFKFTSGDEEYVIIDEDGNAIGVKETTTPVTVTVETEDGTYSATCEVTVKPAVSEHLHVEGTCEDIAAKDGVEIAYEPWTNTGKLPTKNGYYYLTEDLHLTDKQPMIPENANIHICLNGFTIDNVYEGNAQTISMFYQGATLSICDCSEAQTGKVVANGTYDVPGRAIWARYGTLNLFGGTVVGATTNNVSGGGAIAVFSSATFNMYGGTIKGGEAQTKSGSTGAGNGGAIANTGKTNIYGGTIEGGKAGQNGGAIYNGTTGYLVIDGDVTIKDGEAAGRGGNIYSEGKQFTVNGATISGGKSVEVGGNVYFKTASTVTDTVIENGQATGSNKAGGNVHIAANTTLEKVIIRGGKGTNSLGTNLHMNASAAILTLKDVEILEGGMFVQGAKEVILSGNTKIGTEDKGLYIANTSSFVQKLSVNGLGDEAKIYVTAANEGAKILKAAADIDKFVSYHETFTFAEDENGEDIVLGTPVVDEGHKHCVCGGTIEDETDLGGGLTHTCDEEQKWTEWTSDSELPVYSDLAEGDNFFFLTSDVKLTENWRPGKNGTTYETDMNGRKLTLCLNGHKIYTETKSIVLSTLASSGHTKNVDITLTDCAETPGSIELLPENKQNGSSAMMWINGTNDVVSIYNITVDGHGLTATRSGGIFALGSGATLNLYSGTVKGGKVKQTSDTSAYKGGLVYVASGAAFNMYGGTLTGGEVAGSNNKQNGMGGNIASFGTVAIYGGVIENGKAEQGGNIYASGTFTIDGDVTVKDGTTTYGRGGNIFCDTSCICNITDAAFVNGTSTSAVGGSIYTKCATFNLTNTTVTGGKTQGSSQAGGNISIAGGNAVIKGCTFSGGSATNVNGNEVHMNSTSATLRIEDSEFRGNMMIQGAKSVTLKGLVKIGAEDQTYGLRLMNNTSTYIQAITVESLTEGSDIVIAAQKAGEIVKNGAPYVAYFRTKETGCSLSASGTGITLSR